jgi:dolichyl-phosphate beta-glucosyltransferase
MAAPFLSVVVPAYNEEARIPGSLEALSRYLDEQSYSWEVIVVDDGSTDGTRDIVRAWAAGHDHFRLEEIPHAGKGAAVRHGMLAATGDHRFMCDADLAMPITLVDDFLKLTTSGWDVVVASREMAGAKRVGESRLRHVLGRVFNRLVHALAVRGFDDTQCGFKCFRGAAASVLFSQQRTAGWGFDVEILYLARKKGMQVVETPIQCYYDQTSKVRVRSAAPMMLRDILMLRWRAARGVYDGGDDIRT